MSIFKIKSPYIFAELFSFIAKEQRKLKIIQYNNILIRKLCLSINDYKNYFFGKRINKYDNYTYVYNYWIQFQNEFNDILKEQEYPYEFFLNLLPMKNDFILNINDQNFDSVFENINFQNNIRIDLNDLPFKDFGNINYLLNNLNEYSDIEYNIHNFFQILNKKINKLCLCSKIDIIYFNILNKQNIFSNLVEMEISSSNLEFLIELNIICNNVEILYLYIIDKFNENKIIDIFPKLLTFKIYIQKTINLMNLIKNIKEMIVEKLEIIVQCDKLDYESNNTISIILNNIKYLRIENLNEQIFLEKFYNIQFPNLENYIINSKFNEKYINLKLVEEKNDYDKINKFIFEKLNNEDNNILLNDIINFSHQLKKVKYLEINLGILSYIYDKIKNKFEFNYNKQNELENNNLKINLLIDEKGIYKYKQFNIKGLNNLYPKIETNYITNIIEDKNINLENINLFPYKTKYYINCLKNIKSIYCEDEIQKTNFFNNSKIQDIINENKFDKLKYIDLTIGYFNINNDENIYYLSKLIKNSINLKTLILRLNIENYNKNLSFFLSLIQDLKKLRVINIFPILTDYNSFNETLLNSFPKLKKRRYIFEEFINKQNIIKSVFNINKNNFGNNTLMNFEKQDYRNKTKEMYFDIYLNNNKIDYIYHFKQEGIYQVTFKCKIPLINMNEIFYNCYTLKYLDLSNFKTDNVIDMNNMLSHCLSLTSVNLTNFKTDNVIDMSNMFTNCISLKNIDLFSFNTSNVEDMSWMFSYCSSLTSLDLSNFKTENVIDMNNMFSYCSSLTSLNISNFNTNNVTDMSWMFSNCSSIKSLDLSNFVTNNIKKMNEMFSECNSLVSLKLSNFNTENVIDMSDIFSGCTSLKSLDLSNFNTNKVTNMKGMFSKCSSLTSLDLSNFKTENVIDMNNMFSNCSSLTSLNISNFKTDNLKNMNGMFYNCSSLTSLDLSNFKTDNVVDMEWMFSECSSLTTLNLSKFNTKNVTNMNRMFYKCCSLTSLNLSNFNTYNVTVMSYMFSDCSSLINLDLSKFNTNKVTVMSYMFFNCRSLINLELSNFNADNVDDMSYMFCNCSSLKTLDLTNFTIINYPCTYKTFYGVNKNCQLLSYDKKILSRFSDFVCQKKNNNV